MSKIDLDCVATESEMTDFVKGLFAGDKLNPATLNLAMPDVDADLDDVDFATESEVTTFINSLFDKK